MLQGPAAAEVAEHCPGRWATAGTQNEFETPSLCIYMHIHPNNNMTGCYKVYRLAPPCLPNPLLLTPKAIGELWQFELDTVAADAPLGPVLITFNSQEHFPEA